tara:strand:+ start:449 stop:1630 length:1182 start_codon:yes stop_codon:yes gene_type:complete
MPRTSKRKITTSWGQGTITKRSDKKEGSRNLYRVQIVAGGKRRSVHGATAEEALEKAQALALEFEDGISQELKDQTFSTYSHNWLEKYASTKQGKQGKKGLSLSTTNNYKLFIRHICEVIGDVKLKDLRAVHIEQVINKDVTDYMKVELYDTYKRIEKYAFIEKALPQGKPSDSHWGRPSRPIGKEIKAFTGEQAKNILATAKDSGDEQLYVLMVTLFQTGMRINEALALQWSDCNLESNPPSIFVGEALQAREYPIRRDATKNGRQRPIELGEELTSLLRNYKKSQSKSIGSVVVFPNAKGGFLDSNNWTYRKFKPLMVASNIDPKEYSPHSTRHTFATLNIMNNGNIYNVSEMLGHADPSFTVKRYTHYQPEKHQTEANALNYLLPEEKAL